MTRWHFSIQALRHHSALAWLQVPSSSTTPSISPRMARWLSSTSPLRLIATISPSVSRSADLGRAEIEHGPARGIVDRPPQRLGQARPGQPDLHASAFSKCMRGQPRGAERPVLLLRMLQDQQRDPVLDRRDAVADAQRHRLAGSAGIRESPRRSAAGSGWFDMRPLYASSGASTTRYSAGAGDRGAARTAAAAGRSGDRSPASCRASGSARRTGRR